MRLSILLALPAVLLAACAPKPLAQGAPASPGPIPPGKSQMVAEIPGFPLEVFTDKPNGCRPTRMLLVFAGIARNADGYRDNAIPLADKLCAIVVSPRFDLGRFPSERYQRGGIVEGGVVRPEADWTTNLVPRLITWVREKEGNPKLEVQMIGHSAGAQFLSRVAAYTPTGATAIVVADPSTWVWPSLSRNVPYGFGGLTPPGTETEALRRYLALPLTVLVGGNDTGRRNLVRSREADAEGANRLDRAENAYTAARAEAAAHGWPFGWRLIVAPGVAHDSKVMFASDQAEQALKP